MGPFNYYNPAGRNIVDAYQKGVDFKNQQEDRETQNRLLLEQQMGIQEENRKKAMVDDAKRAELLIRNGDNQGAMSLLSDRAQQSSQSGGNPRETMQVYNALRGGKPEEALQMITNFRQLFDEGYQATPTQDPKVGRFRTERIGDELIMYDSATSQQVKSWKIPETKKEQLELKKTVEQIKKAESENQIKALTAESAEDKKLAGIDMMREASTLARELASDEDLGSITGNMEKLPTFRPSSQDLVNKAQRIESLLTVDNLKLMSGVLTDRDITFLTRVASGINVTDSGIKGSESATRNRLNEIAKKLEEGIAQSSAQQPQVGGVTSQALTPEEQAELDALEAEFRGQ